jgi:hypothetical protein
MVAVVMIIVKSLSGVGRRRVACKLINISEYLCAVSIKQDLQQRLLQNSSFLSRKVYAGSQVDMLVTSGEIFSEPVWLRFNRPSFAFHIKARNYNTVIPDNNYNYPLRIATKPM